MPDPSISKQSLPKGAFRSTHDEQRAAVARLTADDLAETDTVLLRHVPHQWRKVARVVGEAMSDILFARPPCVPDVFYAERVRRLAGLGIIESVGILRRMRYSEVRRRPPPDPKDSLH